MEIYGIERHFKLTVGAYREVAAMLPGGNIEELGAALTSDDPFRTMAMIFNLAVVMSKWYEKQQSFLDPDYKKPRPLTLEELETLPMSEVVGDLKDEIIRAIVSSQETEIPLKKTEGNAKEED